MEYLTGAYRDVGCRKRNEDSLGLRIFTKGSKRFLVACVADGIGSLEDGDVAGGYVVECMLTAVDEFLLKHPSARLNISLLKRTLQRELYRASLRMNAYASRRNIRMGTTLSMVIFEGRHYLFLQIGDSGIFKVSNKRIKRIAPLHIDNNGVLLRCVGSFRFQTPTFKKGRLGRKKALLLATDGFFRKMEEESELHLLDPETSETDEQIDKRLATMGERMKVRGERDNMSALYIRVI